MAVVVPIASTQRRDLFSNVVEMQLRWRIAVHCTMCVETQRKTGTSLVVKSMFCYRSYFHVDA